MESCVSNNGLSRRAIYVRSSIEIVETSRQGAHEKSASSGCRPSRGTALANTMGLPHAGQTGGRCGPTPWEIAHEAPRGVKLRAQFNFVVFVVL